jgi:hypothetical protein
MCQMALPKGVRRYQHNLTKEVRYFRNPPNQENWTKIGTPGSKNWKWINNTLEEKFISPQDIIPEGFVPGRIRA